MTLDGMISKSNWPAGKERFISCCKQKSKSNRLGINLIEWSISVVGPTAYQFDFIDLTIILI